MVAEVLAAGGDDGVVVAAAQPQVDLAGDGGRNPSLQGLAQHQGLRVEPAAFIEQPTEAATLRVIVGDRVFVVDGVEETLKGDVQQRHCRRLVDAAGLRLDDAVLDLVGHAEPMATADGVGLVNDGDRIGVVDAVDPDRTALDEPDADILRVDGDRRVPEPDAHDRLDILN